MKNNLIIFLIAMLFAACGTTNEVQEVAPPTIPSAPSVEKAAHNDASIDNTAKRPRRPKIDPEQLVAQLGLSEEQEVAFLALWENNETEMKALRETFKGDRTGMRERMMELRESRQAGINEILTDEQQAQYQEILSKQRRDGMKKGRGSN